MLGLTARWHANPKAALAPPQQMFKTRCEHRRRRSQWRTNPPTHSATEEGGTDELGAEQGGTDVLGAEEGGTDELGAEPGGTDTFGAEEGGTDSLRPQSS